MLTISAAPSSMASAATVSDVIDSSRQTGVDDRRGEPGVAEQVVLGQRLLDQQKVELVEPGEVVGVGAGVGGVGVDLQRCVRPDEAAHGGDGLEVAAGLDLQLDADVAVVHVAGHGGEQLVDGVVDADADAARDARSLDAEQVGERAVGGAQLGVEHGHLQRRLRHRVAANRFQHGGDRRRGEVVDRRQARREDLADDERRPVDVLRRVRRLVAGDALAPSLGDRAVVRRPRRGRAGCAGWSARRSWCGTG